MAEIEHQGTVAMGKPEPISRELLGKIVDEVFDGAIEDASVIEEIYAAIKKHETPAPQDHVTGVDIPRLPVGTPVEKIGGYPFPGTIVAAFYTLAGQERFVVEATGDQYAGMLHIFNGGQLRAAASEGSNNG